MKKTVYKLFLVVLRGLVYLKRFVSKVWYFITKNTTWVRKIYQKTFGFYLYKLGFSWKKTLQKLRIPWDNRLIELLGKRGTLQLVLFVIALGVMYPHSAIYSQETPSIPGRETVLYAVVGPGEQDFQLEEIAVDVTAQTQKDVHTWRSGAVVSDIPGAPTNQVVQQPQDIVAISTGGTALTKPSIIPGSDVQTVQTTNGQTATKRSSIITHTVQPGEVIGAIAQRYGISISTILEANNLTYRSYIQPGDKLKILPTDGVVYSVRSGDTVASIAQRYGADKSDIIAFNNLGDGSNISIGDQLILPGGAAPQVSSQPSYTPPSSIAQRVAEPLNKIAAPQPSVNAPAGSGYVWPTTVHRITQYFGWRHTGVDIAGPIGTPLIAARSGRVIRSQCGWNGGYGCYVILDHGGGINTLYAHSSRLLVSVGDYVTQGQTLALMGSTGNSTGPHIHFEVRVNGNRVNPLSYVR